MILNSPKFISKIKRVLFLILGLVLAGIYINTIIHVSIIMVGGMVSHSYVEMMIKSTAEVLFAGSILAVFEVFYFTDRFKKRSFGYAILIKSLFYFGGMITLIFLITVFEYFNNTEVSGEKFINISSAFFENISVVLLTNFFPWIPVFLICIIFLQVSDKYGQGVFLKFMYGKYHSPKEETRIFMFLDIKSSTSIAEVLGSLKYFDLINDFFYDATDAIIESRGEIYQYVGDEVVITWTLKNGIENSNCLNCFFDIYDAIRKNSGKYEEKYGLVPSFKAGVHYGIVTVGEIGVVKREIIFTGDVLNTTSRIQELCNKYNQKLLVSKDVLDLLEPESSLTADEIGQMNLRGRAAPVVLYSVKRKAEHKSNEILKFPLSK